MSTLTLGNKWLAITVLGIIILLGASLRVQDLTEKTIAHIEIYVPGIQLPSGLSDPNPRLSLRDTLIGVMVDGEPHPPAYYILMLGWTRIFGTGILALRLPSVLFGIGSIILIGLLGMLERDKWTGILAAGMLALNGHQVFWSQTAKMYSLGCFLGLLSTVLLLLAYRQRSWQRVLQAAYLLVTLAGLTTVVYFWLLFLTHVLWVLVQTIVKRNAVPSLLQWQFLVWILASPLLSLAIFQSHRESYLSPNPVPDLIDYLQFGFVFEPDPFALSPQNWLMLATLFLLPLGLGLLVFGLWTWRKSSESETAPAGHVPWALTVLAGLFAFASILRLGQFTRGLDPARTLWVLASSIIPLLLVGINFLLLRYWDRIQRMGISATVGGVLERIPNSPSVLLAILPVAFLTVVAPILPLFASRTAMLFTPYLLIVLAWGVLSLLRRHKAWVILLPALVVIFGSSIIYYRNSAIEHPTDYKGLSEQWMPEINDSDLIFVQRHWVTTPIFYYLKASRYHFVGGNYAGEIVNNPQARIWVLNFQGLPLSQEMEGALQSYSSRQSIDALRVHAILYTKDTATPTGTSTDNKSTSPKASSTAKLAVSFSTYLGGSQFEEARDVTTDAQGNVYVVGHTKSPDFPTTPGAFQRNYGGGYGDIYVVKFDPSGKLLWSTLLGGPGYDYALAIRVDRQGDVYISGLAGPGAPTTPNSFQPTYNGFPSGAQNSNAYVAKLSADGSHLIWASYVGPFYLARSMDLDANGDVYLAISHVKVETGSPPPPAWFANAPFKTPRGGDDLVVAKIKSDGTRVLWATYFGGSKDDGGGPAIAVDSQGYIYVASFTNSTDLPVTPNAFQRSLAGGNDIFVAKIKPDGSGVVFATYLGGSGDDLGDQHDLAVDAQGNVYVGGDSASRDFPTTPNAFQRTWGGGFDGVIAKLSPDGSRLLASTYLGGSGNDGLTSILFDPQGNLVLPGGTNSPNFPVTGDALQSRLRGGNNFKLSVLSPDLHSLLYSTYMGGSGMDAGRAGWVDAQGNIYVVGNTSSDDWPVKNPWQPTRKGDLDAAVIKFAAP